MDKDLPVAVNCDGIDKFVSKTIGLASQRISKASQFEPLTQQYLSKKFQKKQID